ncbi:MAG TPA: DUF1501 domain-containing protein [Polyangia bacterium]|nr:DUF1501 domain-containing protein [Polyangia bacterium]
MERRRFLELSASGLAGLLAARLAARSAPARAASRRGPAPRARACIVLWCNGGPSHVDTWDPKPGAPFRALRTRAPAIEICEHLPRVAAEAHRLAIVRSLSSREGNHDRAQFLLHTGYAPNPTVAYPSLGAWVSEELGAGGADLPGFVSISGPSAGAGFLGVAHGPFVIPNPSQPPQNLAYPSRVDFVRFARRRSALETLEQGFANETGDARVQARRDLLGKAIRIMYSTRLRAFDLQEEPDSVRAAYGDTDFGRGCLLARRLVEAGVRFVEVVLDGWDTHQNNFERTKRLMGTLDPALATLLAELFERDLLRSTLVLCLGEFGRTPSINANEGRDHYPGAFSAVLAGGGIRGGLVHGATDEAGGKVVTPPVAVADLFATCASLLGLDPALTMRAPGGRPVALTDNGKPLHDLIESS